MWPLSWQFCSLLWHSESILDHHVRPLPSCNPFLVFRFNDESYPWQTNHTCPSMKGRCYDGIQQGLRRASFEIRKRLHWNESPFLPPVFFFITRPLSWTSPLGGWSPKLALRLTSASPSHYSAMDLEGQCYQVDWCYKINWMLRWGKCWRWWTERAPAQNHSSLQLPWVLQTGTWAEQLDDWLGKRLQSELNMSNPTSVVCWRPVTLCSLERLPVHIQWACQVLE